MEAPPDALIATESLAGGLGPRLGRAHLRTLLVTGFPHRTCPGLLEDLNALAFSLGAETAAFSAALLGLLVWTQPAFAALACPSCFGFEPLARHLYVDRDMSAGQRTALAQAVAAGEMQVQAFYGELKPAVSQPLVGDLPGTKKARRIG